MESIQRERVFLLFILNSTGKSVVVGNEKVVRSGGVDLKKTFIFAVHSKLLFWLQNNLGAALLERRMLFGYKA